MKRYFTLILMLLFLFSCTATVEAAKKSPWRPGVVKKTTKKKAAKSKAKKKKKIVKKKVVKKKVIKKAIVEKTAQESPIPPEVELLESVKSEKPAEEKKITPQPKAAPPQAPTSKMAISPKIGLGSGGLNSFGVGCEFNMPIMPQVDLMLEASYWPVSGAPVMMVGGNGIYKFAPVQSLPVNFFAGGGLFYQMIEVTGVSGINALGFQVLGGADIPIEGMGLAFAQMKYGVANYSYSTGGSTFSESSGGFVLEGGYRFQL